MDLVIPVLTIVAFLAAWHFWLYKRSGGWNPLWMAFSATAAAVLFLITGVIGYTLSRHERFVAHAPWAGHVIWSQVLIGLLAGLVAVYFWRKGLQRMRRA
jgi:hypothetical protein